MTNNLKDFTKAEFLSFLYAEKSREIENNFVPGWNKWALIGAIVSIIIFLYHEIITNYIAYDYEVLSRYTIILTVVASLILLFCRYNSEVKLYMPEKVRPLKDEVPVLLYIFQFGMCLIAGITQLCWRWVSFAFVYLAIAVLINAFILIYIFVHKDHFVLAKLKTQVFVDCKKDNIIHSVLIGLYFGTILSLITDLLKTHQCFCPSEFEFSIGLIALIMLIYMYLKTSKKNNGVADEIDRIINKFVVGAISQEDAYKKYILIMYGFSAYQTIENDLEVIEDIKSNYSNKVNTINNLISHLQSEIKSFDHLQKIQQTLEKEIYDYKKTLCSLSKLLDKINKISELGLPAIVDNEFSAVIDDYEKASSLFSDLITQIESVTQKIEDAYFCKKYGGLCLTPNCTQRDAPMSLKYKLKRKIRLFFKR